MQPFQAADHAAVIAGEVKDTLAGCGGEKKKEKKGKKKRGKEKKKWWIVERDIWTNTKTLSAGYLLGVVTLASRLLCSMTHK